MLSFGLLAGTIWNASEIEMAVASEFADSNSFHLPFGFVRILESTVIIKKSGNVKIFCLVCLAKYREKKNEIVKKRGSYILSSYKRGISLKKHGEKGK